VDGDGGRAVHDETDKQHVEVVRREERACDGEMISVARTLEGQAAARRSRQRVVSVLAAVAEVDDELVYAVLELDVAIAGRTGALCRHRRTIRYATWRTQT